MSFLRYPTGSCVFAFCFSLITDIRPHAFLRQLATLFYFFLGILTIAKIIKKAKKCELCRIYASDRKRRG